MALTLLLLFCCFHAFNPLEPKLFQETHEIHKLTFSSDCNFDILWSIPTISGSMESSLQDEHSHTQFSIDRVVGVTPQRDLSAPIPDLRARY